MNYPSVNEAKEVKVILDILFSTSSTSINMDKSQIFSFNTPLITQRNIKHILGFPSASLPYKYLGAPLTKSTINQSSWIYLLNKLNCKFSHWTFIYLNLLSHLVLLKFVLQAMHIYLLSVLVAPKWVLKSIRNLQWNLFWGGYDLKHKLSIFQWETLWLLKESEGLACMTRKWPTKCLA